MKATSQTNDALAAQSGAWFEAYRSDLMALAYRMLGELGSAEDVLQEAWLRVAALAGPPVAPRAYLRKVVTNLCLDVLKSARHRRETYVGQWLPEPLIGQTLPPEHQQEIASDVSFALLLLLEKLSPLERAAFLLHDVFDTGYTELAEVLGRSQDSCRQLVSRAREHLRGLEQRFAPQPEQLPRILSAFAQASQGGDLSDLASLLIEDVVFISDGGGRVASALKPIYGRDKVLRFIAGVGRKWPLRGALSVLPTTVNGELGVVVRAGSEVLVLAFEMSASGIRAIYQVRNPDKLRHLQGPG
jgi:RNA polymerase sigma-70 factor (ECF subfamily)